MLRKNNLRWIFTSTVFLIACFPSLAMAQDASNLNSGDTAWMLTATALVLFMTIPGLSLFYGGLVRSKNVLSVLMQCFVITALITVLWVIFGYSIAFDTTGMEAGKFGVTSLVGGFSKAFLSGVTVGSESGTIPETVFFCFQLTFAIITPALIIGAFAERMKFSAMLWFMGLWFAVVYAPICHMVWSGNGSLMGNILGVLDFAGGTVVHINAGIAALVAALLLGKRKGYPTLAMPPHNLPLTVTGAGMLWVGWFGFNAGSALAANGLAGMAMTVTQIATAAAALTWMFVEWMKHGKPSVLGIATGAVAGLVAITPASGTAGPMGALLIGVVAGIVCFLGATSIKRYFGYDDSLDAFGVHGIGGFTGAILTGICAWSGLGGHDYPGLNGAGMPGALLGKQVLMQLIGSLITVVYSGIASFIILKVIDAIIGLRVNEEDESIGLDVSQHEERAYNL